MKEGSAKFKATMSFATIAQLSAPILEPHISKPSKQRYHDHQNSKQALEIVNIMEMDTTGRINLLQSHSKQNKTYSILLTKITT
jgi:hypothetical protein